jgi:hypothetical protein
MWRNLAERFLLLALVVAAAIVRVQVETGMNLYFLFVGLPVLLLVAVLSLLGHYLVQIPRRMSQQIEIVDTRHVRTTTRLDQKRS